MVEGEALATGIDDPGPRRLGEPERAHLHRRHLSDPLVVGDGAHDHSDLVTLQSHEAQSDLSKQEKLASHHKCGP